MWVAVKVVVVWDAFPAAGNFAVGPGGGDGVLPFITPHITPQNIILTSHSHARVLYMADGRAAKSLKLPISPRRSASTTPKSHLPYVAPRRYQSMARILRVPHDHL